MEILFTVLLFFHVLVCVLLVLIILMQRPKQEGLGAAFASGMMHDSFGAQTTDVLQKGTRTLGIAFFVLSISMAVIKAQEHRGDRQLPPAVTIPAVTEIPPAAPADKDGKPAQAPKEGTAPAPKDAAKPEPAKTPAPSPAPKPESSTPAPEAKPAAPAPAKPGTAAPSPAPAPAPKASAPVPSSTPAPKPDAAKPVPPAATGKVPEKAPAPAKPGEAKPADGPSGTR